MSLGALRIRPLASQGAQSAGGSTLAVTFYPKDMPEFEGRFHDNNVDKETKAQAFHNMGNSLLQAGQLEEAIEAYKNAKFEEALKIFEDIESWPNKTNKNIYLSCGTKKGIERLIKVIHIGQT